MAFFTDQTGRTIRLEQPPERIVSLVPSQTELLYHLGLEHQVAGITKFCVHPQSWFRTKTRIGGTKKPDLDKIRMIQPQLILANKEENTKEHVDELALDFPVWVSDVNNLADAEEMILSVGAMTNRRVEAENMKEEISKRFLNIAGLAKKETFKTAYFIWRDPWMTIGRDTFISDMMGHAGFENIFAGRERYPLLKINELKELGCQVLFLSSEPYPFSQKHREELQKELPQTEIFLVDGEMFSWYGSRLLEAPAYFEQLHQQVLSLRHALRNR